MKNKILTAIVILGTIIIIYFQRTNFNEHILKKTISSCVIGQKRTSVSFDIEKAKKFCEEKIRKQRED
jgi:hypothetical protein